MNKKVAKLQPRVMHVITGLNVGGAENQLALLTLERRKRGFEDVVINLTRGGAIKDKLVSGGVIVHDLGLNSSLPNPYSLLRFRKYVNIYKPDIVQSWMYHANLFSVISLKLLASKNLPLIWGIRCSNMDPNKYNFKFRIVLSLCKALSNIADVTLANSYAGKLFHQNSGYKSKQWEVIINGVETKIFKPDMSLRKLKRQELQIAENEFVIAHVGRVDPMKDHNTFFAALKLIPNIHTLLVGAGTERFLNSNVRHCLGRREDIPELLSAADLLVSSSAYGEGLSNSILEGMACGLPIVATETGDSAKLIAGIGKIVPPSDSHALAFAIKQFIEMPKKELDNIKTAARKSAEQNHSINKMLNEYDQLYNSIL